MSYNYFCTKTSMSDLKLIISFRLDPDRRDLAQAHARDQGVSLGQFVRDSIDSNLAALESQPQVITIAEKKHGVPDGFTCLTKP
jgi:uncharacterized protein (DUF1778 family)